MFTGLIEDLGTVLWIRATDNGTQLQLAAPGIADDLREGDSVSVNGCCLTVAARRNEQLTFDLLQETLSRTNLRALRRDSRVNLEFKDHPHSNRNDAGWKKLFQALNLEIIEEKQFKTLLVFRQVIYVLKKSEL